MFASYSKDKVLISGTTIELKKESLVSHDTFHDEFAGKVIAETYLVGEFKVGLLKTIKGEFISGVVECHGKLGDITKDIASSLLGTSDVYHDNWTWDSAVIVHGTKYVNEITSYTEEIESITSCGGEVSISLKIPALKKEGKFAIRWSLELEAYKLLVA